VETESYKDEEVNEWTLSLLKCFFSNNSRLVNASKEEPSFYIEGSIDNILTLKDGVVYFYGSRVDIYGYCLGAHIKMSRSYSSPGTYEFSIMNRHKLLEYADIEYFDLSAYEITCNCNIEEISLSKNKNMSPWLSGSKELFVKWYTKAIDKRFPMSKNNNPLSRFLY